MCHYYPLLGIIDGFQSFLLIVSLTLTYLFLFQPVYISVGQTFKYWSTNRLWPSPTTRPRPGGRRPTLWLKPFLLTTHTSATTILSSSPTITLSPCPSHRKVPVSQSWNACELVICLCFFYISFWHISNFRGHVTVVIAVLVFSTRLPLIIK